MGPLVAVGGFHVADENVRKLEVGLDGVCREFGFPPGERFKWSPRRGSWMFTGLVDERRTEFYRKILAVPAAMDVRVIVVIEDDRCLSATDAHSTQNDVLRLLLERVELRFGAVGREGIMVVDRPGGDRSTEGKWLADCVEMVESGTKYVKHERLALNVLTSSSQHIRSLQLADLVTSCTLARVAGETRFAPEIFELVRPLFHQSGGRVHGYGLKIHPDMKYLNLYHWLIGEQYYCRGNVGYPLPILHHPYYFGETIA